MVISTMELVTLTPSAAAIRAQQRREGARDIHDPHQAGFDGVAEVEATAAPMAALASVATTTGTTMPANSDSDPPNSWRGSSPLTRALRAWRPRIAWSSTLLREPDSLRMARIRPLWSENDTPFTARATALRVEWEN
jgi:hypothetical protein